MKIIITESQLKQLYSEQETVESQLNDDIDDITTYPQCVSRYVKKGGFLSQKTGEVIKTKSGQRYISIFEFPNYKFYNNGRVQKPNNVMTNYSCGTNKSDIIVDGVNLNQEKWNKEKDKYTTNYEKFEKQKSEDFLNNMDPHTIATIFQIGTAFIPIVGPFISTTIGLADAASYYKDGDKKTAGVMALFSMIPGIGGLANKLGLGKWSAKALGEIGKKIGLGQKVTRVEIEVANRVAQNRALIQAEMNAKNVSIAAAKLGVKSELKKQAIKQTVVKGGKVVGKTVAPYAAAGLAYNKSYDYIQRNTPKTKSEKEGLNWEFVRQSFGSSGSKEDNILLNNAWKKGWRPGTVVPVEFQTNAYKENFSKEDENINKLNQLVAQNS